MAVDEPAPPKPPSPSKPDDGPRYDDETASAALLRSTYKPYDDWHGLACPDCREQYLTEDALASHWHDVHDDGRWDCSRSRVVADD
jgi:hypothetical protein